MNIYKAINKKKIFYIPKLVEELSLKVFRFSIFDSYFYICI
jgi:hypothetical protein